MALTGAALAEERKLEWSANATGTSDYVFRGISQSDNDPAIQGGADVTYGLFYAGIWGSSIDYAADNNIELDYYVGITPSYMGVSFDFGYIYYNYPDADFNDYWELKAAASGEILPKLTAGGTFYWAPDAGYDWYVYEGSLSYELPKFAMFTPTVSGLVGYTDFQDANVGTDYTYWNAGLGLGVDNISFDLRYWDTDASAAECFVQTSANACSERFVFSVGVSIP